jgi:hypothetical protein
MPDSETAKAFGSRPFNAIFDGDLFLLDSES